MKVNELMEAAEKKDVTIETKLIRIIRTESRKYNNWNSFTTTNAKASPLKDGNGWQYNLKVSGGNEYYTGAGDDPRKLALDAYAASPGNSSVKWNIQSFDLPADQDKPWKIEFNSYIYRQKSVDDLLLPSGDDDDDEVKALRAKLAARRAKIKIPPELKNAYARLSVLDLGEFKIDHFEVRGKTYSQSEIKDCTELARELTMVMKPYDVKAAKKRDLDKATPLQHAIYDSIVEMRKDESTFGKFLGIRFAKKELVNPQKAAEVPPPERGGSTYYFTFQSASTVKSTLAVRPGEVFKAIEKDIKVELKVQGLKLPGQYAAATDTQATFRKTVNPDIFFLAPLHIDNFYYRDGDVNPFISKLNLAAMKKKLQAGNYGRPLSFRTEKIQKLVDDELLSQRAFEKNNAGDVTVLVIELK